jgi:hydroxymethylglutaryl-CoA lyase
MQRIADIFKKIDNSKISVRGYISCCLGCPYEGEIAFSKTANLAQELIALGCYQVSLGDTIGVGTALQAKQLISTVAKKVDLAKISAHFHDTYAQALTNVYACLELGLTNIDSSIAGLGGCPYARGASGNLATEDVLYMLHGMGIETGVSFEKIIEASRYVTQVLGQPARSKVALAELGQCKLS